MNRVGPNLTTKRIGKDRPLNEQGKTKLENLVNRVGPKMTNE